MLAWLLLLRVGGYPFDLEKVISCYPAIKRAMKYIKRDTVKETKRFDKMVKFYQSKLTLPRLMISQHIGIAVEGFLTMFQCKGPLIHIMMYPSLMKAYRTLLSRFIKESILDKTLDKDLAKINVEDRGNKLKKHVIPVNAQKEILGLSDLEKAKLFKETDDIYVAVTLHLKKKLPINNTFIQDVVVIDPQKRTSVSTVKIKRLAYKMGISDKEIDEIIDELPSYKIDSNIEDIISS